MKLSKIFIFIFSSLLWSGLVFADEFPALTDRVVDEAGILSSSERANLISELKSAEPHQVMAVSLRSLRGREIEEYGVQLGRHWGIGRKNINDGVLVLIAPNERQLRIEVGYGLEGVLTDAICSRIVNRIMLPLARQGRYGAALIEGTQAVLKTIQGQEVSYPANTQEADAKTDDFSKILKVCLAIFCLTFIFIIGVFCVVIGGQKKYRKKKVSVSVRAKSASNKKKEPDTPVTESDWEKSKVERKRFFGNLIFLICFFSVFYVIGIIAIFSEFEIGLFWLCITTLLSVSFFIPAWLAYRANKYYPMREWYKRGFSDKNGGSRGSSHWSSGGSSGGSSFSGGGGSFGGGGSSGRW